MMVNQALQNEQLDKILKEGVDLILLHYWRGICPVCKKAGVKLLWDKLSEDGTIKVCKVCGNK